MAIPARRLSRPLLRAHGLVVDPQELEVMVRFAVAQLQESLFPEQPQSDLTVDEAATLARGGLDLDPREEGEGSALARTTAKYAAILETSLTTAAAADLLGVEPSRVRQRLAARTLWGIRTPSGWRLPACQFSEDGALPDIGEVVARLSPSLHPVAVHNFLTLPHVDLWVEELGRELSPREWLQAGYPSRAVVELAANLE